MRSRHSMATDGDDGAGNQWRSTGAVVAACEPARLCARQRSHVVSRSVRRSTGSAARGGQPDARADCAVAGSWRQSCAAAPHSTANLRNDLRCLGSVVCWAAHRLSCANQLKTAATSIANPLWCGVGAPMIPNFLRPVCPPGDRSRRVSTRNSECAYCWSFGLVTGGHPVR